MEKTMNSPSKDTIGNITIKKQKLLFVLMCIVFCGLYFIRDIFGFSISFYFIYIVACLTVVVANISQAFSFFLALTAFSNGGFNGVFAFLIAATFLVKLLVTNKKIKISRFLALSIVCVFFEVFHIPFDYSVQIGEVVSYVVLILVGSLATCICPDEIDRKEVIVNFICFSLFFAVMAVLINLKFFDYNFNNFFTTGMRTSEYTEAIQSSRPYLLGNQNFLTSLCSINLCLCTLMLYYCEKKIPYVFASVVFVVVGLLTISKMFFVVLALYLAYIAFSIFKIKKIRGIVFIALLGIIAVSFYLLFKDTLIEAAIYRFRHEDLTTGRIEGINQMMSVFSQDNLYWLFGTGILNLLNVVGIGIHSSFFEAIGGWGIGGVLLFFAYYYVALKTAKEYRIKHKIKINVINYLPLFIAFVYALGGMVFSSWGAFIRIIIFIYSLELGMRDEN